MLREITVPDIGNYTHVDVIEVLVAEGDAVKKEDALITLETEKASMEVPAPFNGTIQEMRVAVGSKVSQGDVIAVAKVSEETQKGESKEEKKKEPPKEVKSPSIPQSTAVDTRESHAGPATRRLARELGVDLALISGSGPRGRVTVPDVSAYAKGQESTLPEMSEFQKWGEISVQPLTRIKKWTAKNLHRNWTQIPHVTQWAEADVTELERFRQAFKKEAEEKGVKLTILPFVMLAAVAALKAFPQLNASLSEDGQDLILKKYYHLGIATDTPEGLLVPVIQDVDKQGVWALASALATITAKARAGKLGPHEMTGSSFSISSLGSVGGTAFTPIIHAPNVAILGISPIQIRPLYEKDHFVPRQCLPLSLSYDHRVIDGVEGARFATYLVQRLQDIRTLLL